MPNRKRAFYLALCLPLVATSVPALAQYYVGSDGRGAEANNRLGSYGSNSGTPANNNVPNSNDVLQGNVTGLAGFNGSVPFRQPGEFNGFQPLQPSQILRQVAGYNSPTQAPTYNQPQVWYNPQKAGAVPQGFAPLAGNGAYVPVGPDSRQPQDYRLGNSLDIPVNGQPQAGDATIGGGAQVDTSAYATPTNLINAPIYGARELVQGPQGQTYGFISGAAPIQQNNSAPRGILASDLSQSDLFRLRSELATSSGTFQPTVAGADTTNAPPVPGVQPSIGSTPIASPNLDSQALVANTAGQASTGQVTYHALPPLPPATSLSPDYARLRQVYDQYQNAHPKTEEDANRLFREALAQRRKFDQTNAVGGQPPSVHPSIPSIPQSSVPGSSQTPVAIGSIGSGIRAAGLRQLVVQGEDLARHQKYKDAIAKFLDARQVDPNYLLITIDLANAELGAGYYSNAEQYLREAFTADPTLLMGKYDLTSVVGADRLAVMINDLKRVASSSDSSTPVFLLAYVSYNTGDTAKAVDYLQLAQSRAGGSDEVVNSLAEHWSLPTKAASPATQPAK